MGYRHRNDYRYVKHTINLNDFCVLIDFFPAFKFSKEAGVRVLHHVFFLAAAPNSSDSATAGTQPCRTPAVE